MAQPIGIRVSRTYVAGIPSTGATTLPQGGVGLGAVAVGGIRVSRSFVPLGDAGDLLLLQQTLHNLALAIKAAENTAQTEAAAMLRQQWAAVKQQLDALIAQQNAADQPSALETGVASIADFARQLGGKVALIGLGALALLVLPMVMGRRRHW